MNKDDRIVKVEIRTTGGQKELVCTHWANGRLESTVRPCPQGTDVDQLLREIAPGAFANDRAKGKGN